MRGLASWLLVPALAHAQDVPARLSVERAADAEACEQSAELQRRIENILHRQLQADGERAALAIVVRFERAADGAFLARVSVTGPKPGRRSLRDASPNCDALGDAVSVAIALLLDSSLDATTAATNESDGPTTSTASGASAATPSDAPKPAPQSGEAQRWRAFALAEAGAGYGLGGSGTALGFARIGFGFGHWSIDLGAGGGLPTMSTFDAGSVSTSLFFASLRGCYALGRTFRVAPCAQLGVGQLRGEGEGYGEVKTARLPWTAAGFGLVAELPLGPRLFAGFGATLWVPSRRQTFSVENAGIAWESKPVGGVLSAGVGLRLF